MSWLAALAAVVFSVATFAVGYDYGRRVTKLAWEEERAVIAQKALDAVQQAREKEAKLVIEMEAQRREYEKKVRSISSQLDSILAGVRERPDRSDSTPVSETTTTNCVCTGAQLARRDAEFLARYAADAARTREALDQCVRQYDEVRQALER
jgi:hypothetical protein